MAIIYHFFSLLQTNVVEAAAVFVLYPFLQVQYANLNGIKDEDLTTLQKATLGNR